MYNIVYKRFYSFIYYRLHKFDTFPIKEKMHQNKSLNLISSGSLYSDKQNGFFFHLCEYSDSFVFTNFLYQIFLFLKRNVCNTTTRDDV